MARWVLRSCAARADSNGPGNVAHGPEMRFKRGPWDVGHLGVGAQKLALLSDLDAGRSDMVPRARCMVVLIATGSPCPGTVCVFT